MTEPRHFFTNYSSGQGLVRNWLIYLWLLPLVIGVALIGIFFFVALMALFSMVVLAIAMRFWWLRRKLQRRQGAHHVKKERHSDTSTALEGEYKVIVENKDRSEK